MSFVPLFPGVPGGLELAVILLIAILLFGANKIPKLARSTGQAMGEFKRGREEIEQELQEVEEHADPNADIENEGETGSETGAGAASTSTSTSTSTDGGAETDRATESEREN